MHRSGTSLVARALNLLGADVGPAAGLLPPDEGDNPTGYWEQQAVIDLNNELLVRLGGSSWSPPRPAPGWEADSAFDDLAERARGILATFAPGATRVVKDPRLSLTLPFWRRLAEDDRAVVCLRSPVDVVASLVARDPHGPLSKDDWTAVCAEYNAAATAHTRGMRSMSVVYDDWFRDPDTQIDALSCLLGTEPGAEARERVRAFVSDDLRHQRSSGAPRPRPRRAEPRTSVLMAAYDPVPGHLAEAVESVLAQTVPDLELIVVDDGSETPLADVLRPYDDPRLRVVRHPGNRGVSAARNTALRLAGAPLVSHLDSDDAWEPDYLEHVLPALEDRSVGLAYANTAIVEHPEGHDTYIFDPAPHPIDRFPKLAEQNPVPLLTATVRTEAVRSAGGYARWLKSTQDYYLWCRLAASGWRFAYVDRKLARYRWPATARSLSYHRRRVELEELGLWTAFVMRHPLTPGPRRQVRTRLGRELRRLGPARR